jgi:hypothetical protein
MCIYGTSPLLFPLAATLVELLFDLRLWLCSEILAREGTARPALVLRNLINRYVLFLAIHDFALVMK